MDILIWKSVHYITIQMLRKKKDDGENALNDFLDQTAQYYKAMIEDLKQQYGLNEVVKKMENTFSTDVEQDVQMDVRWALVACHRFLIYLGDLGNALHHCLNERVTCAYRHHLLIYWSMPPIVKLCVIAVHWCHLN